MEDEYSGSSSRNDNDRPISQVNDSVEYEQGQETAGSSMTTRRNRDHGAEQRSLCAKLFEATVSGYSSKKFIPIDAMLSILNYESVSRLLAEVVPCGTSNDESQRLSRRIFGRATDQDEDNQENAAIKVLALLILMERASLVVDFLDAGIIDRDLHLALLLPKRFSEFVILGRASQNTEQQKSSWSDFFRLSELDGLEFCRSLVTAPVFSGSWGDDWMDQDVQLLPIIESFDGEWSTHNYRIFGVKIHPAHHNLPFMVSSREDQRYAITRFSDSSRDMRRLLHDFRSYLQKHTSPHIWQILTGFSYLGQYHVISFCPCGNLDLLWKKNPRPALTKNLIVWVSEQLDGITQALAHDGQHLTLLPSRESIFWVPTCGYDVSTDITDGILQINPLDSTFPYHQLRSKSRSAFPTYYRPPEALLGYPGPVVDSEATAIGSFGSVILEIITWLVLGRTGLSEFDQVRLTASRDRTVITVTKRHILRLEEESSLSGYLYDLLVIAKGALGSTGKTVPVRELQGRLRELGEKLQFGGEDYACQPRSNPHGFLSIMFRR